MKIRLEIPKAQALPSQGRNADSISAGGTTAFPHREICVGSFGFSGCALRQGDFYRAWLDTDKPDAEFVFFVGWGASNETLIFEDKDGDLHVCGPDEVEAC